MKGVPKTMSKNMIKDRKNGRKSKRVKATTALETPAVRRDNRIPQEGKLSYKIIIFLLHCLEFAFLWVWEVFEGVYSGLFFERDQKKKTLMPYFIGWLIGIFIRGVVVFLFLALAGIFIGLFQFIGEWIDTKWKADIYAESMKDHIKK